VKTFSAAIMKCSSDRPFSISWRIDSVRLWAPNSSATSFSRISNSNRYLKVLCSVLSALAALRLTPLIHEINASAVEALTIGYTLVQATMRNHGHARSRQPVPEIHLVSGLVQFNVLDAYLPAYALLRHVVGCTSAIWTNQCKQYTMGIIACFVVALAHYCIGATRRLVPANVIHGTGLSKTATAKIFVANILRSKSESRATGAMACGSPCAHP